MHCFTTWTISRQLNIHFGKDDNCTYNHTLNTQLYYVVVILQNIEYMSGTILFSLSLSADEEILKDKGEIDQ